MHVLTKVFIVLVSLLSVLLVPLVVVYSQNEDSYKAKYEAANAQKLISQDNLRNTEQRNAAVTAQLGSEINELNRDKADLESQATNLQVQLRASESKLVSAEGLKAEIFGKLATLSSVTKANQLIVNSLLTETRGLRSDMVRIREQNTELDEALREVTGQLEVAIAARRALHEELQRIKDEQGEAMAKIADFTARFGDIEPVAVSQFGGIAPDVDMDTAIIAVRRNPQGTYAEIDAGERDGVKVGWIMTIHHGGKFIGNLRIEQVDINRATGVVLLEDESRAGLVQVGHRANARAGGG